MYTVLNNDFQVKGSLTLNNGRGGTAFFSDTITQQIATDDSNNPDILLSNSFNDYDKQGNTKQWNHALTLSVEATNLGTSITTSDYIMYFDEVAKKYYMMKVIDTATDRNSGFIKVDCINTAIYELGKQLVVEEKTFKNATLSQVVESVYKNAPFSIVIQDDLTISIDYTISANTSLQSVIQDIQTKYNVDVDSWITLDNDGQIGERVLYFGHLGSDNGELIRYGGGKGFENINAQELSDIIYTKVYITGVASDTDTKKGHIGSVNNGLEYIVDDDANQRMYTVGASQQQPVYLEGQLTNNILSEPSALLDWGKQQLALFNHPRFNYTVTPLHDEIVGIGDSITVQDFHIQPMILVTSKVIQKSTSFASPETNTFVLGEFSSIFSDRASKNNMVIEVIKKDVTVVQAAADIAKAQADEAHRQAILAQEQAIHAQTSADGKTTTYTVDSVQDLPDNVIEGAIGWVKLSDGTHMYSYTDGKWVEKINPSMGADINKKVSDVVTQAKDYSDKAIADTQVKVDASIKSVDDKANQLKQDQSVLDIKAQGYANQALSDAKANTAQAVKDVTTNSQTALDQAKTDLTTSIAKEAADRATAVSALDTKAQGYVSAAKTDVLKTVNKEITDRSNAVTALDTKAKGYADTAKNDAISASTTVLNAAKTELTNSIASEASARNAAVTAANSQAQTYANQAKADALNTIAKEVTDRQNAVTALDTKATNAVNQAKSDITDTIKAISVGGRNLLLNSKTLSWGVGTNTATTSTKVSYDSTTNMWHITSPKGGSGNAGIYFSQTNNVSNLITKGQQWAFSFDIKGTGVYSQFGIEWSSPFNKPSGNVPTDWTRVSSTGTAIVTGTKSIIIYFNSVDVALDVYIKLPKLESGSVATDWTPAPEDVVLDYTTKDNQIKETITQYKDTNDGKVSKAQTDATTALGQVATKVSQTDYDTKTGDLTTKYTEVKQTADSQATDIVDIKKTASSQASKINSISSDVDGTKQSISDINTEQGKQSSKINQISSDVDGTKQSITDIQTKDGTQDTRMGTIETSVSGVKSDFSTYKTDANGRISTAQTTAQTAVDGLKTKVSQTDYNTKTGQLQTDLTTTTQTANQAKTDIVSIKQTDTSQDSRMNTIESDASGTKQTVSQLQTVQGQQSGSISTLQQRADGFDATVTKVDNLSVGGRNLLLGTGNWVGDSPRWAKRGTVTDNSGTYRGMIVASSAGAWNSPTYMIQNAGILQVGKTYTFSTYVRNTSDTDTKVASYYDNGIVTPMGTTTPLPAHTDWFRVSITFQCVKDPTTSTLGLRWEGQNSLTNGQIQFAGYKLEEGNVPTDWTPAPEDVDSATAKAQLTADNASVNLSNYQTDADGRISRAQSDITQTAKDITTKVSQTDYDKKTGDLTTKVNTAQSTADSANSTISAYKTSNDGRVSTAESKISQNTTDITTKVSQTAYNAKTNQLQTDLNTTTTTANKATTDIVSINQKDSSQDARMTTIESDANGTKTTVSNLQTDLGKANGSISTLQQRAHGFDATVTKVDNLSVGGRNYVINSSGMNASYTNRPALQANGRGSASANAPITYNSDSITLTYTGTGTQEWYYALAEAYQKFSDTNIDKTKQYTISVDIKGTAPAVIFRGNNILSNPFPINNTGWTRITFTFNFVDYNGGFWLILNASSASDINGPFTAGQTLSFRNFKLESGSVATDWTPAPEDGEQATAKAQLTADNATTAINNYKTSNDGRVASAESKITQNATDITQKVSKTDYNQKTGQLQTDLNTTTNTANTAKQDIATIKTDNTTRDSKINTLQSDSTETKRTISKLSGDLSTVSGSVSTLQQRADGFDATVTKVDNLSVGGRNLLLGTGNWVGDSTRWAKRGTVTDNSGTYRGMIVASSAGAWNSPTYMIQNAGILQVGKTYTFSTYVRNTSDTDTKVASYYDNGIVTPMGTTTPLPAHTDWFRVSITFQCVKDPTTSTLGLRWEGQNSLTNGQIQFAGYKLEEGNVPTDWTPAPEDVDSATAKAQLTADNASVNLSNYQTDADGRISRAQSGVDANTKSITAKVSQSDYDKKTGDLNTKVSTAQQTAEQANTTIGNYQKSNDGRVISAESAIKQNADNIASKVSQSDYNTKTGKIDSQFSTINQNAQAITTSISKVSDRVDAFNAPNLFQNSEFETDTGYRNKTGTVTISGTTKNNIDGKYNGTVTVTNAAGKGTYRGWWSNRIPVQGGQVYSASVLTYFNQSGGGLALLDIWFVDKDNQRISAAGFSTGNKANPYWIFLKSEGLIAPQAAVNMEVSLLVMNNGDGAQTATFAQPMVTATDKVKPYTPNITDKQFSQQQQTIDSINSTVQQQGTNINNVSTRVQTAEGSISTAQNNISGLKSSQKQTADGLSQEVSDRKSGDSTVLQQGKDFTISQVSNSESNMKSLISQKADSTTIGVIKDDVSSLKSQVNWQQVTFDDMNYLNTTGNYLITGGKGSNSPFAPWFYITVDAPRTDRITQTVWKDSNSNLTYKRSLFGTTWSAWSQVVSSATLLNIFHDSWSLGTTTNDGITKQMVTGIMGQPDGTLILKGNSLILDGNTTVTGDFYAKGGNFQNLNASNIKVGTLDGYQVNITNINVNNLVGDTITGFNINANKQITIASGGSLQSDIVNMSKTSFGVSAPNVGVQRYSPQGYNVTVFGTFSISSVLGNISTNGSIQVTKPGDTTPYKKGDSYSTYGVNNMYIRTLNYDNKDPNEHLNISSAEIDIITGGTSGLLSDSTNATQISSSYVTTTGSVTAGSAVNTGTVYSGNGNLWLNSANASTVLQGGGTSILQVRENGYMYYLTFKMGSGGSALYMTSDGAIIAHSSATKYKTNIEYDTTTSLADRLMTVDLASWNDKNEERMRQEYKTVGNTPDYAIDKDGARYVGLIAEDLVKADLEEFVVRDVDTGSVESIRYDRIGIALIPAVRQQRDMINELRLEIERLKDKVQ